MELKCAGLAQVGRTCRIVCEWFFCVHVLIIHHCNCGTEVCRTCAGEVAATFGSEQEQFGKGRKSQFGFGALLRAGSLLIRSVLQAEAQARQTFISTTRSAHTMRNFRFIKSCFSTIHHTNLVHKTRHLEHLLMHYTLMSLKN